MKIVNKLTGMITALITMSAALSVPVNAADIESANDNSAAIDSLKSSVAQMVEDGTINEADAALVRRQIDSVLTRSGTYTFPAYYTYPSQFAMINGNIVDYYAGFFTTTTQSSTNFKYIINDNVFAPNPTVLSNYHTIYNTVNLGTPIHLPSGDTSVGKCYKMYIGITNTLSTNKTVYYMNLGHSFASDITDPGELKDNIRNKNNSTSYLFLTDDNDYLRCSVFCKGDVNRDGLINSTDSEYVLAYVIEDFNAPSYCNEELFRLSADLNGDKNITILDVIELNSLINS